jgi:hypothetical protein
MQRAKAGTAAAMAEAKKPTLPAMATLPFMDAVPPADATTGAASAAASAAAAPLDDGARALFGPPNLSKAAAPILLPCVTGSGHGPMGLGARSPTTDSDCSSPFVVGAAKPPAGKRHRGAPQAAAAADDADDDFLGEVEALPDELWLQDAPLPLPLLGAGAGEGQQAQPLPAAKAPFEVGSAEEAAMWHDVLQFYLGEDEEGLAAGAGGGAGVGAVGAAGAWAGEEPGFGWER